MLARQLIAACGGLNEAQGACRVRRAQLSNFQNLAVFGDPKAGYFMPIDVIADLEAYCGEPIYSRAVADERPATVAAVGLLNEACEISEESGALLRLCRMVDAGGRATPHERRLIEAGATEIEEELRQLRAAASAEIARVTS